MEPGACIAMANCNSLLEYGKTKGNGQGGPNPIMKVIQPQIQLPVSVGDDDVAMVDPTEPQILTPSKVFITASELTRDCDAILSKRYGDHSILPYFNVRLSFLKYIATKPDAMKHIENYIPWSLIALTLNPLSIGFDHYDRIERKDFSRPSERPFPEDWSLRGLLWTDGMFPESWFSEFSDDDEKLFEFPSMAEYRRERILWLGWQLAAHERWIQYDSTGKRFKATPEFDVEYEGYNAEADTLTDDEDAMSRTTTYNENTLKWIHEKEAGCVSEEGSTMGEGGVSSTEALICSS